MRDSCSAFVRGKNSIELVNFKFNGWAKYPNHKKDEKLPEYISEKLKLKRIIAEYGKKQVVLEGSAIDINGRGTLIITEECLMDGKNQIRNSGFIKKIMKEYSENILALKMFYGLKKELPAMIHIAM
jgi:agmatine deiminase